MARILQFFIRTSAFLRKEMVEVLRQPRLILALIFGPFLILLLFGLGYRNEARPVRTVFVISQANELTQQIEQNAPSISPQLIYAGTVKDKNTAERMLANNQADMMVVVPENANDQIRNNEQAVFELYHNEIDPNQASYIEYLGQVLVEEVNRRVLSNVAQEGQTNAAEVQQDVSSARQNAANMRQALQSGNVEEARLQQTQMRGNISAVAVAVGASVGLLSGVEQSMGPNNDGQPGEAQNLLNLLNSVQENDANKNDVQDNQANYSQQIQELEKQEKDLADLETRLKEFQSISPSVLTRPFAIATHSLSPFEFTPMNFFTPGVIALLLQHITITIAALSIVRERRAGMIELFRVSPLKASETLIGKYISYMIFGIVIAAVLALLLAYGLQVPMLGSWQNFAIVVLLMLFSSLGIGFFISLIASTESQAVQYAMIALLLSVFFSGFILDLRYMVGPVRLVSWLLPATYGTILLQDIMLRGSGLILIYILGLAAIGVVLFLVSLILMRRQMAHE